MSENKVVLNYDGKSFEYPIVDSVIGDRGIDISKLRDQTGLITLDLGYKNTGATLSEITYLDGDNGELFYRGYPIEQKNLIFPKLCTFCFMENCQTNLSLKVLKKALKNIISLPMK